MQKADILIASGAHRCIIVDVSAPSHPCRMLMPRGAVRLRDDLGTFLKKRRQGGLADRSFGTQRAIAGRVGICRQTLSDIERGAAWPGPSTLDALLDALELGWEDVAHPEPGFQRFYLGGPLDGKPLVPEHGPARHRLFMEGDAADQLLEFGRNLRDARKENDMTLDALAARAGVSAALLSRVERGQVHRSSIFRLDYGDLDDAGRPRLIVENACLAAMMAER